MKYSNRNEYWDKVLLYEALKRTVTGFADVVEAAHCFHRSPDDSPDDEDYAWNRLDYEFCTSCGYIRYDEEGGWMISENRKDERSRWRQVAFGLECTYGYAEVVADMDSMPSGISGKKYVMVLRVPALDPDLAWASEQEPVGGETPTVDLAVDEETWHLMDWAEEDLHLKRTFLINLICGTNPADAAAIRRFLSRIRTFLKI